MSETVFDNLALPPSGFEFGAQMNPPSPNPDSTIHRITARPRGSEALGVDYSVDYSLNAPIFFTQPPAQIADLGTAIGVGIGVAAGLVAAVLAIDYLHKKGKL